MANVILKKTVEPDEKVALMRQDALFDVSESDAASTGLLAVRSGIRSAAPPPQVPKVFLANDCAFNCAYCACRCGNEGKRRYASTPRELAELSLRQARGAGRGIFLTSAIFKNADYTQELIIETMRILRGELNYGGYLHAKVMPGADAGLIRRAGLLADRLSVNIEVAKAEGYQRVAKNKNKANILGPMGEISRLIREARGGRARFAASQTTQLMAGSSGEDDRTILNLVWAMYRKYGLSRVYYTAFTYRHRAAGYDALPLTYTPLWRMKRLYQADRLIKLYGFAPGDIAPEGAAFLQREMEPKAAYALRNPHLFPVEVGTADYEALLRVPGIGSTGARRILAARRLGRLSHDTLRQIGISLKRSRHFITCGGKFAGVADPAAVRKLLTEDAGIYGEQLELTANDSYCESGD